MTDPFIPDVDHLEQNTPVAPDSEGSDDSTLPPDLGRGPREASDADILDQNREVPLDDDDQ